MQWQRSVAISLGMIAAACTNGQLETTAGSVTMGFEYETVDLPLLLARGDDAGRAPAKSKLSASTRNEIALAAYHRWEAGVDQQAQIRSRNQVQDRLLGASNQLCHNYELYMQDLSSQGNFWSGLLTTAAATAGTLFSGGTSQIFAGVAAVSSGGRAEFNQDFFYKEAVPAIFKGIRAKRMGVLNGIMEKRSLPASSATVSTAPNDATSNQAGAVAPLMTSNGRLRVPVEDYTVEAAIADAIDYHWQCSLASGIAHLGSLATLSEEVGVQAARNFGQANSSDGRASAAINNLLIASTGVRGAIEAAGKTFPKELGDLPLPDGKTVNDQVKVRQDGHQEVVAACAAKATGVAAAVSAAQQRVASAPGNGDAVTLDKLNVAISNAALLASQLQEGVKRYAEEIDALSRKVTAVPVADGKRDPALVKKAVGEAFPGDKPSSLGC